MKILHIDDSQDICEVYSYMLNDHNHDVTSVTDGEEGLELAINNEFDLILLDMVMPNYDGMDFLRNLKIQKPSELKKVIIVSHLEKKLNQLNELFRYGIHSIQKKPSELHDLENTTNLAENKTCITY